MGDKKKNVLGSVSLAAATAGFLIVELQPWIPLGAVMLFGGLTLKGLFEAFFEASMAGAVADWFAVTALFRDPLGLPLPHTSILAKNKDSIADAIPHFLTGFLSAEAMAVEFRKLDFASKVSEALSEGGAREDIHAFLKDKASELLLSYGGRDTERVAGERRFVGELLDFVAERVDAPGELASLLGWARKERYDERILEGLAEYARLEIGRNRPQIVAILTPIVKRNAGWKGLFINSGTIDDLILGIQDELAEVKADRTNDARRFLLSSLASFSEKLQPGAKGGEERGRVAEAFKDALADSGFREGFALFVAQLLARLGEDLAGAEGRFIPTLERIEEAAAARLSADEEIKGRFNDMAASLASLVVERGNLIEGAANYVAGLLRSTDERYFVEKIEESVWNDLQYIRLNGAVVGGLVGLVIALIKAATGI
jgi:Predicted membrane protein